MIFGIFLRLQLSKELLRAVQLSKFIQVISYSFAASESRLVVN